MAIFWEERLTTDPEQAQKGRLVIVKDTLFEAFSKWAEKNGFGRTMNSAIFFRRLFEHGEHIPDLKPGDRATIDGERVARGARHRAQIHHRQRNGRLKAHAAAPVPPLSGLGCPPHPRFCGSRIPSAR